MDATTVERMYRELRGELFGFLKRRVGRDDLADDLLHDVFVKIHERIDQLGDNERFRAWLYRIAHNTVADHFRGQRPVTDELPDAAAVDHEPGSDGDVTRRLAPFLRDTLAGLSEIDREALLLTEYEGRSQRELAELWGISIPGAKSRVQRARQRVRDLLLACCHVEFDRYGKPLSYRARSCPCCEPAES